MNDEEKNDGSGTQGVNSETENSKAPYNDSEAGNTPNPTENGGEGVTPEANSEAGTEEQKAETEGESVENEQPDAEAPTGATPEDSEIDTAEEVAEATAEAEASEDDEVSQEDRDEFERLKTKRKNMPLDGDDIARFDALSKKING